jgi:uncharacterized protein
MESAQATRLPRSDQGKKTRPASIAPAWHTVLMILLVLAPLIQGILADKGSPASTSRMPPAVAFYLTGTAVLWIWFAFLWWGLRLRGNSLRSLVGERWSSGKQVGTDIALALLFWAFWYAVLSALKIGLAKTGVTNAQAAGMVYPHGALQICVWIVSALSAGIVEEAIFRGYLMKQFAAWFGSAGVGVVLQALLFGVGHGFYLGIRQLALITVSGLLIGVFALWRKNLQPAMAFHAWADIFGAVIVRGLPFQ